MENQQDEMEELKKELRKTRKKLKRETEKYKEAKKLLDKKILTGPFSIMSEESGIIRLLPASERCERLLLERLKDMGGKII